MSLSNTTDINILFNNLTLDSKIKSLNDVPGNISKDIDTPKKKDSVSVFENEKSKEEIVINKGDLDKLLSELSLVEMETIIENDNSDDDDSIGDKISEEDYFEAVGDVEKIKNLSPWTPDGPILKKIPNGEELLQMTKNLEKKDLPCLLLGCSNIVCKKVINTISLSPWYLLCSEHRKETTKRYGYGLTI